MSGIQPETEEVPKVNRPVEGDDAVEGKAKGKGKGKGKGARGQAKGKAKAKACKDKGVTTTTEMKTCADCQKELLITLFQVRQNVCCESRSIEWTLNNMAVRAKDEAWLAEVKNKNPKEYKKLKVALAKAEKNSRGQRVFDLLQYKEKCTPGKACAKRGRKR